MIYVTWGIRAMKYLSPKSFHWKYTLVTLLSAASVVFFTEFAGLNFPHRVALKGSSAMENSVEFPQKSTDGAELWPTHSTAGHLSEETPNTNSR